MHMAGVGDDDFPPFSDNRVLKEVGNPLHQRAAPNLDDFGKAGSEALPYRIRSVAPLLRDNPAKHFAGYWLILHTSIFEVDC